MQGGCSSAGSRAYESAGSVMMGIASGRSTMLNEGSEVSGCPGTADGSPAPMADQ